jgi:23S rRNA (uracil1939-C5)-methyltransferase
MARNHSKNRFIPQEVEGVEIVDISEDGRGIGKKEGEVYFVRGGVPGEKLTLEVYGKKKSVKEASIARIEVPSPLRVTPFCRHFGECGGCKWQHMSYLGQLEFKEKQVRDALERIGKIDPAQLSNVWKSIFPSSETQYYRNKLEFTFTHRRWKSIHEMEETRADTLEAFSPGLGFHVPGSFDKILDIEHCYLQKEPSNSIRNQVKEFCIQESIPFFELRSQAGLMRNLLIRTSNTDETMVIIVFAYEERSMISKVMNFV